LVSHLTKVDNQITIYYSKVYRLIKARGFQGSRDT